MNPWVVSLGAEKGGKEGFTEGERGEGMVSENEGFTFISPRKERSPPIFRIWPGDIQGVWNPLMSVRGKTTEKPPQSY